MFVPNMFTIRSCGPRGGWTHHSPERDQRGGGAWGRSPAGGWRLFAGAALQSARQTQGGAVLAGRAERPGDSSDFVWRAPGLPLGPAGGGLHSGPVQRPAGHTESSTDTLTSSGRQTVMWQGLGWTERMIIEMAFKMMCRLACCNINCFGIQSESTALNSCNRIMSLSEWTVFCLC